MELYEILLKAHSGIRWLVLAMLMLAIVKLTITWLGGGTYGKGERVISKITVGLLDLMFLIGLSMVITLWSATGMPDRVILEHAGINLVAIILAHIAGRPRGATDPLRARNGMVFFLLSILLIVVAILRLPQGFTMT